MSIITDVDTRGFDRFVERSVDAVEDPRLKSQVGRAIVFKFLERVIPNTPVDTGRARAGWTAVPGSSKLLKERGAGTKQGRSESEYKESTGRAKWGAELTNAVPYIVYLELGSSQQAPSGVVRLALREIAREAGEEAGERVEAALRLANIKARREIGLRQGIGRRPGDGRLNIRRR